MVRATIKRVYQIFALTPLSASFALARVLSLPLVRTQAFSLSRTHMHTLHVYSGIDIRSQIRRWFYSRSLARDFVN